MWANAQRDGRPTKYRWRPLFNAAVWLTPNTWLPCSNAANTRNPLNFAGMPQSTGSISAASGPKFTIYYQDMCRRYCCLTNSFPIVDYVPYLRRYSPTNCTMVHRWRLFGNFLRPMFPASRVQHVSDLYPKFKLRLHHVWKHGRHPISDRWD